MTSVKVLSPGFLTLSVTVTVTGSCGVGCLDVVLSCVPVGTVVDSGERKVTTKALTWTGSRKTRSTLGISLEASPIGVCVIVRYEVFSSTVSVPSGVMLDSSPFSPSIGSRQYPIGTNKCEINQYPLEGNLRKNLFGLEKKKCKYRKIIRIISPRVLFYSILIPGVVDLSDVVVLERVVSSVILVVGVVTVVTLVVISVVEYSKRKCVLP